MIRTGSMDRSRTRMTVISSARGQNALNEDLMKSPEIVADFCRLGR